MSPSRTKVGLLEVLGYILGGALLLSASVMATDGTPPYLVLGLAASGVLIILGSVSYLGNRRIFPAGIIRQGNTVVCRYIPWRELNAYVMFLVMPLIGISALAAGSTPGSPAWVRFVGLMVLGGVALAGYFAGQMWRRCLVKFTPASLEVRLPARGSQLTEIPRSHILSIASADAKVGAAFAPVSVQQVALTYMLADPGTATATVLIGPPPGKTALQVSVKPANMFEALVVWSENPEMPPNELMDQVERFLRG